MLILVRKLRFPDAKDGEGPAKQEDKVEKSDKKPEGDDVVSLAKALKEARENSVSKEEFNKVKQDRDRLVSEIINGDGAGNGQDQTPKGDKPTIEELREKLYGPKCNELSNLDYWITTLALRDAVIEKGDPDPFLPFGAKISPTGEDVTKAQNVADVVSQCIEESEGNSEVFTALLQSRMNNDSVDLTMRLKKLGIKYK